LIHVIVTIKVVYGLIQDSGLLLMYSKYFMFSYIYSDQTKSFAK